MRDQTVENTANKRMKVMEMTNSKGIWLAQGETQSVKGDSALQSNLKWETMLWKALCLDQQCAGRTREQKNQTRNTLIMKLFVSKA